MIARRFLMFGAVACALAGCGSEESSDEPELSFALKEASKQLEQGGFNVEARNVDTLAISTPVLVVTEQSSASALVAEKGAIKTLPDPAAGVPTNTYVVCDSDLVAFTSKGFEAKRTVERVACAAKP